MKALLLALPLLGLSAPAAAETILAGNLITDAASDPMGPATIVVEDGKIVSIARQGVDFRSDYVLNKVLKKNVLGTMGRLR